ncbi:MAG: MFS transporter [Candidatus Coatesbacteria bacterium]
MTNRRDGAQGLEMKFIQLYFWVYWLQCLNGTWLNLYLNQVTGYSKSQIGYLSSIFMMSGVVLTPLIAIRFDVSRKRPAFLAALALLAGFTFCLYTLPVPWPVLIPVAVAFACGWMPLVPLMDTVASMEHVTGASKHGYGGYRRWGTVGFALAGVLSGRLTGAAGLWSVFPAYLACALAVAWFAWSIPAHQAAHPSEAGSTKVRVPNPSAVLELLRLPNFRRFLAVILFASIGSAMCYTFRSIYLSSIGLSNGTIGMLWLLIIPGEFVCFTWAARWMNRWGTGPLVMFGLVVAGLRWILLSFARPPWLYAVEILHGIGFAVYYPAAVAFVQAEAPARLRGTAQVLFFSVAAGLGSALGAAVAGRMSDVLGMQPVLWFGGGLQVAGGILQIILVRHRPPQREGGGQ